MTNLKIKKPTLLLNEAVCRSNIECMATKARRSGVRFRPHFKTHQSSDVGRWFHEHGVDAITVSSVSMASYFAQHGWRDITIAFSVNWLEIDDINRLAQDVGLGLLVESPESVEFLAENLTHNVDIWLDVDTGYKRTGINWEQQEEIVSLAKMIAASPTMHLRGMLTHAGHSYKSRSLEDVQSVYNETVSRLSTVRDGLYQAGFSDLEISIGDTPCCCMVEDLSAVDEIRPGNFVFFDLTQVEIGACAMEDVAVAVACPVVAVEPERRQIVVYGGGVHLSKDSLVDRQGRLTFGAVARQDVDGWCVLSDEVYVKSLSQEHGVIHADAETLSTTRVGDVLLIIPVHSCMTADLLKQYVTLSGNMFEMAPIPR